MSKRLQSVMVVMVSAGSMIAAGCLPSEPPPPTKAQMVERGHYLVSVGGCNDCHSPKIFAGGGMSPDDSRLLSGHPQDLELPPINIEDVGPGKWLLFNEHLTAAVGPWGVSFAANLTPDEATGLGDWTEEEFVNAMRTGTHRGIGRPILPPMPWFNLAMATDDDLRAIFAYLQSLPPISKRCRFRSSQRCNSEHGRLGTVFPPLSQPGSSCQPLRCLRNGMPSLRIL